MAVRPDKAAPVEIGATGQPSIYRTLGGSMTRVDLGVLGNDGTLGGPGGSPLSSSVGSGSPPSPNWLLIAWALAPSFTLVSASRDSNDAITTASVLWPDGATGTFTTDTASTAFPGSIDAYHVTYVWGGGSHTITQTAVTRDANGAVIAQPTPTVA